MDDMVKVTPHVHVFATDASGHIRDDAVCECGTPVMSGAVLSTFTTDE